MISKTILCVEGGLFSSWAFRLAKEYERVLLFRPWTRTFSHPNDFYIGTGYEEFERVEHFWAHVDEADTICFLDVHFPDWAAYLRSMGKPVWSAFYGEELELYRKETKDILQSVGLPVAPYEVVVGMEALREHLQEHDDQYVKISKLRGLTETFHSQTYDLAKVKLDEIEHKLGGASTIQEFICEDAIDAKTETGYDGWNIDGRFPRTAVVAAEIKDCGSAAMVKPYNLIPRQVRETNEKLSPVLAEYGYRGFFSTEVRITKDSFYPTDLTCRAASPCGENIQELISNIGEVIEAGANGELLEPKPVAKYAAQAMISSQFADENWLPIYIPDDIRQYVKLYHNCKIEGQEFIVPTGIDMSECGSVVATGNTLDEAIRKVEQYAKQIEGYQIKVNTDSLYEAKSELNKAA